MGDRTKWDTAASVGGGIGSLLTGAASLGGLFGKKESSGRNLGAKEDEFNQRAYYSYGITPYELISNGGAGKGGGIAQGEAMSARNHDAQMKAVAKDLALKAQDLQTQRRNVDETVKAQRDVANTNAKTTIAAKIIDAMKIGNVFNPALLMSDVMVPYVNSLLGKNPPKDEPKGESLSAKEQDKKEPKFWTWEEGDMKKGLSEGADEMMNIALQGFNVH